MSTSSAPPLDFLSLGGNFLLVIALLLAVLWGLRRMQGLQGFKALRPPGKRMVLLETLNVGTRQKIVLMRVDQREVLVGITPTQFSRLESWPVDGSTDDEASVATPDPQQGRASS